MSAARKDEKKEDRKANRRGAARLAAVQALYQMDIAGTDLDDILAEFESHRLGGEVEHFGNGARASGNRQHHVLQAIFNALGDFDFAFARE